MMLLPITTLYAIPLTVIFLILWLAVTKYRAALHVSVGDGGDIALLTRIRWHGNFCEWVPVMLILMVLAEANGAGALWLHGAGALAVIGRAVHPFGLKPDSANHPMRIVGNTANIAATLVLIAALAKMTFGF